MFENMTSNSAPDLCTGGQVKIDPAGLRCFKDADGGFVCDVGYSFAKQALTSGDMSC